jgi:Transcriptional regulators of sugar metabolism
MSGVGKPAITVRGVDRHARPRARTIPESDDAFGQGDSSVLRYERLNAVLDMVARQGRVSVEQIVDAFALSPATVRRDLDELAAHQLITRTRGGAVAQALTYDLPLRYKHVRRPTEKRRIAAAAARMVVPGMVIALNGGTTNSEVARTIAGRTDLTGAAQDTTTSLTVVTNALNIANELAVWPHIKLVVLGGVSRPQSYELVGSLSVPVLRTLTIDLMFLGVDAIDPVGGAATVHEEEAVVNRAMVERSNRIVAVADSTKLGRRAFCTICEIDAVHVLVTDTGGDPRIVEQFSAAGVEAHLV